MLVTCTEVLLITITIISHQNLCVSAAVVLLFIFLQLSRILFLYITSNIFYCCDFLSLIPINYSLRKQSGKLIPAAQVRLCSSAFHFLSQSIPCIPCQSWSFNKNYFDNFILFITNMYNIYSKFLPYWYFYNFSSLSYFSPSQFLTFVILYLVNFSFMYITYKSNSLYCILQFMTRQQQKRS